ncbi:hypothetical protein INS49_015306 [Diaporthe citri]|uniref:uncharacterized protein n=1 Tax=Diaporthe citri TaxID=83186 RepID=UPI001C822008|nr:uncharacterized protein INS49_015306 [Diaporthe citri]KAG6355922.1 hypothetical protein INS49_015306 [Diaporthe citri]
MAPEDNMPQKSPFAKLFDPDAQVDKQLQKIRDRIYYFAWSRDRRDEAKLDWVLSENGVNRNVHLRWIAEALSGLSRNHINGLPCWLHLVNRQISADFIRFIYSVNDLDILVDLKADHTEPNEAKLDTVVNLLHNANFKRYTRSARVRIHFPDKYPFQNLPVFNQHALDNIAVALDGFQQLAHLSVRVVPMQGPEVYELRLATFPFYPMSMTNWSIRMLNSTTYNWDVVGGEQLHHLNLAWELFQETGSLTATVNPPDGAKRPASHIDQVPGAKSVVDVPKKLVVNQKKNGSQKRKGRKLKALSAVTAPSTSKTAPEVTSDDPSLRSSSASLDHSKDHPPILVPGHDSGSGAELSHTKLPITGMPSQSAEEPSDPVSPAHNSIGTAQQPSSPASPTKLETTSGVKQNSASEVTDENVENDNIAEQNPCHANPIDTAPEDRVNSESPQEKTPSSSAPSSVTLGRDQSEDEAAIHNTVEETPQVETTMRGAGVESEKPVQKKRRNRKKGKKTQSTDTAAMPSNDESDQQLPVELEDNGSTIFISTVGAQGIFPISKGLDGILFNGQREFPLAEIVELERWTEDGGFLRYKRENGRRGIIQRNPDLDRVLRQKERMAAQESQRRAEKLLAKGKRKTKKVKEVMIRRKGDSNGLRRSVEDTKQLAGGREGSDLRRRFNEITGERLEKETTASQASTSEDSDSSDEDASSPEGQWSSPEQARYPQRESLIRHEHLDTNSVSHHRNPSSSFHAVGFSLPGSTTQVLMFPKEDDTGEDGSQVEHEDVEERGHADIGLSGTPATNSASAHQRHHQGRQMDEQHLIEELEDSGDCASVISQYGDEGPPSISDDESQNSAT